MSMGEGERGRFQQDHWEREGDSKNQRRQGNDRETKTGDELVVYRILCPDSVIGSVIGKSGKVIHSVRQDILAKVKVVDPFPGARDRVIIIYCYVSNKKEVEIDDKFDDDEPLCPAQDLLIKVHAVIAKAVATLRYSDKRSEKEECWILVPASQAASIIGKSGSTIERLRNKSGSDIKVVEKDVSDPTHACALAFDSFVLISGDPEAVKKALFAVSTIMYKFSPKEEILLETDVQEAHPTIIIPSDDPMYHASGLYYPAVDHTRGLPPVIGTTPISDLKGYADAGSSWPIYSPALPVVSGMEELRLRVLCPKDKIGRVIGKGGSTIKTVARIEVDDAKSGGGDDCLVLIISAERCDDLIDRISGLPNRILSKILSLLPLKEAGKSCVLSRRWINLWKFTTNLNFVGGLEPIVKDSTVKRDARSKYIDWVNKVLNLHRSTFLDDFRIRHDLDSSCSRFIDTWFIFSLQRCPKSLEFDLSTSGNTYSLSPDCYIFLTKPSNFFLIERLTSLSLKSVNINGKLVEYLLAKCHFLEHLSIVESEHLITLKVVSTPLKHLSIRGYHMKSLEISSPRLMSFTYIGYPIHIKIGDLSLISKLTLGGAIGDLGLQSLLPFSNILPQLETLDLQLQALGFEEIDIPELPLTNLKDLTLRISSDENSDIFVSPLIKAAPSLKRCTIETYR